MRFDPSTAFCPADGRYNSTLSSTDSHQVHQRLAFQIVKEQYNDQLSTLPTAKCANLIPAAIDSVSCVLQFLPGAAAGTGGAGRDRTDDLLLAKQALSQLSYSPGIPGGSGWIRTIDPRLIKTVL